MVETGGETTPGDLRQGFVEAGGDEDIAVERGHDYPAIRQEVERRGVERGFPRIGFRELDPVDHVGLADLRREFARGLDRLRPAPAGTGGRPRLRPAFGTGRADRGVGDLHLLLAGGNAVDFPAIDLIAATRPAHTDPSGILGPAQQHRHPGGRLRYEGADEHLGLIGIDDARRLDDAIGRAGDAKGEHAVAVRLERDQAVVPCPQRAETLATRESGGGIADGETGEVIIGGEIDATQGRRVLAAGHEVHLADELARPATHDPGELGVVREGMLAVLAQAQSQAFQRGMLGGAVGLPVHADGGEDPATRRLRRILGDGTRLRGLTQGQDGGGKEGDE